MSRIFASNAYFIKLGEKGSWEDHCLQDGIIKIGYKATSNDLCEAQDWQGIYDEWKTIRNNKSVARRDVNQIRTLYESGNDCIFITFHHGKLYWCKPKGAVTRDPDGNHVRSTLGGWSDKNIHGKHLTVASLSGDLSKVQMFQGTICKVHDLHYLLSKLNDDTDPTIDSIDILEKCFIELIIELVRKLGPKDFELLIDLIFRESGWKRIGVDLPWKFHPVIIRASGVQEPYSPDIRRFANGSSGGLI